MHNCQQSPFSHLITSPFFRRHSRGLGNFRCTHYLLREKLSFSPHKYYASIGLGAYVRVYCVVWYGMVWYGMVWYGMVWYGMVWYGMVWYGMVW